MFKFELLRAATLHSPRLYSFINYIKNTDPKERSKRLLPQLVSSNLVLYTLMVLCQPVEFRLLK